MENHPVNEKYQAMKEPMITARRIGWEEFAQHADRWEDLRIRVGADPLFLGWQWVSLWWETFAPPNRLEFYGIELRRQDSEIVGLIPFFRHKATLKGGIKSNRLQLLGNIHAGPITMRTEYNDFLIDPDHRASSIEALARYLLADKSWDDLIVQDYNARSTSVPLLADCLSMQIHCRDIGQELNDSSYYVKTNGTFVGFVAGLGSSTRRRLFHRRTYLHSLGNVTLEIASKNNTDDFFAQLNELHRIRWGQPVFEGERLEFHAQLAKRQAGEGRALLSRLMLNNEPISVLYNLVAASREYNIQQGFDDHRFGSKLSPGILHLGYAIERAFDDPAVEHFDLLAGGGKHSLYKNQLSSDFTPLRTLSAIRSRRLKLMAKGVDKVRKMRAPSRKPSGTVVITAAHTITGYNTARALYGYADRIVGIGRTPHSPYAKSRIWSDWLHRDYSEESLPQVLNEVNENLGLKNPALLPCDDLAVRAVSDNRDLLEDNYCFVIPDPAAVDRLLEKEAFYEWAERHNFIIPRTIRAATAADIAAAIDKMEPPYILKPGVRGDAWNQQFPSKKLLSDSDLAELQMGADEIATLANEFLIQEWIPGTDADVYFCLVYIDRSGLLRGRVGGRKLLQWPPVNGSTALCITDSDAEMLDLATQCLADAGMVGLGSMEFKRHPKTGQYYMIEPTVGRNDHQSYVGVAAGCNLTRLAFADTLGVTPGWERTKNPGLWIDEMSTLRQVRRSPALVASTARGQLLGRNRVYASMSLADPGVTVGLLKSMARR